MLIIDANVLLRVILNDNQEMAKKSVEIINMQPILLKNEVLAEVIYVLLKVYKVGKEDVCNTILKLLLITNIKTDSSFVIEYAIDIFKNNNLDFVDCLLCAYKKIEKHEIFTFDKALNNLLEKI